MTIAAKLLVGVDGGQTGTRAVLATTDGRIVGRGESGPANVPHANSPSVEYIRAVREAIYAAYSSAGVKQLHPALAMTLGLSGFGASSSNRSSLKRRVQDLVATENITIVPDYVTAFAASVLTGVGVVVIAGGGSVAYAVGPDGSSAVAGGAGYLLGDEGSAFDVGRRGITAAIRASDGRGPSTALLEGALRHFKVSDTPEILRAVYKHGFQRSTIADFATQVAHAADERDETAMTILGSAAKALGEAALAVLRRVFVPGMSTTVYLAGGLIQIGTSFIAPLRTFIQSDWPNAKVVPATSPPEIGALRLSFQSAGLSAPIESTYTN